MMKRGPQDREKKVLSAQNLLAVIRRCFEDIAKPSKGKSKANSGKQSDIDMTDALMSAMAMFGLKAPSLYAFDRARQSPVISHNLRTLYRVKSTPSDTYMRELLDEVNPRDLRGAFLALFESCQRSKLLDRYRFLNGYLLALDGTEVFYSENVQCSNCCTKKHHDGRVTYHHQILGAVLVHPDERQVIPFCPESITKRDGASKNDCESNASKRFLQDLKKEHPRLPVTIVSDALSANAPQINYIRSLGYSFIINVKPSGNKSLFEWLKGINFGKVTKLVGNKTYELSYYNGIPLNDSKDAPEVNFLQCVETSSHKNGQAGSKTFTWVTNHKISDDNAYDLMRGGRARWKIENETFNTLKNQGYQFEHNFGHGKKNLTTVFSMVMMMAFGIDQIQEAACGLFQAAIKQMFTRKAFWERLRSLFTVTLISSWEDLFRSIAGGHHPLILSPNTS